jgi:hypothetical protein
MGLAKWGLEVSLRGSKSEPLMSALGHKQTLTRLYPMSALPPKADIAGRQLNVRFVPKADIWRSACRQRRNQRRPSQVRAGKARHDEAINLRHD